MTTTESSRNTYGGSTLADMIRHIAADERLSPRKRQDVCSALRGVAKAAAQMEWGEQQAGIPPKEPKDIPANAGWIRERLKGFGPAMAGYKPDRWANVQSLTRFAFAHLNINGARCAQAMSSEWTDLLARLPKDATALRVGVLSFARYCTVNGIAPDAVTQATFDAFGEWLNATRLSRNPRETHRSASKLWNQAGTIFDWWPQQKAKVPDYRNSYIVPWDRFPPALKQEVDKYLDHLAGKDRFKKRGFKPLRPASLFSRAVHLHEYCSALFHTGYDVSKLTSLADLVVPDAVEAGLAWFLDERKAERSAHGIAVILAVIAKHWVKLTGEPLKDLQEVCKSLDNRPRGMTAKNRQRMHQFDDPEVLDSLIKLPRTLGKLSQKAKTDCKRALLIQTAVAIEILLMAPIRLTNLSHLEVGRHIIRMRKGVVRLVIPEDEIKNEQAYDVVLLSEPSALIEHYIDKHLPVLQRGKPSAWLFPGYKGPKAHPPLRKQIMDTIKRHCGAVLNPHAFRHLAAKLILDAEPGAYGKARLVLNHTSTATTERVYSGTENAAATRHYDHHILDRRGPWKPGEVTTGKGKRDAA